MRREDGNGKIRLAKQYRKTYNIFRREWSNDMKQKLHIFGASGSGTTTIAKIIRDRLGHEHFDSDNYFWQNTKDPFTVERQRDECLQLMKDEIGHCNKWVLSGSLSGWGEELFTYFDLVVFVYVPKEIRLERLKKREYERYGERVLPGGNRYEQSNSFLEWAMAYDNGTRNGRSLPKHEALLRTVECPVIRIENIYLEESVKSVVNAVMI